MFFDSIDYCDLSIEIQIYMTLHSNLEKSLQDKNLSHKELTENKQRIKELRSKISNLNYEDSLEGLDSILNDLQSQDIPIDQNLH